MLYCSICHDSHSQSSKFSHLEEEHRVLQGDSYIDDLLKAHDKLDELKIITIIIIITSKWC